MKSTCLRRSDNVDALLLHYRVENFPFRHDFMKSIFDRHIRCFVTTIVNRVTKCRRYFITQQCRVQYNARTIGSFQRRQLRNWQLHDTVANGQWSATLLHSLSIRIYVKTVDGYINSFCDVSQKTGFDRLTNDCEKTDPGRRNSNSQCMELSGCVNANQQHMYI